MSHPVSVFRTVESIGRIVDVLKKETHNGFPVVEDYDPLEETVSALYLVKLEYFLIGHWI